MKACPRCKIDKPVEGFYERGESRQSYCKDCFNLYCVERWVRKKQEAVAYKGGVCADCGHPYPYAVFDFHHTDPSTKDVSWTKLRLRSPERIRKELDKTVLLCANCHRMRHAHSAA